MNVGLLSLLLLLLLVGERKGEEVKLVAILPIIRDVNSPASTANIVGAISLGVNASNNLNIINPSFGVTLSLEFRDDQGSEQLALESILQIVTSSEDVRPKGIIGGYYSSTTKLISMVANEYNIPQISGSATSATLSDKTSYPLFSRTVPPDSEQARAIARLIHLYGWSNVGVLYTTDMYATGLRNDFMTACEAMGISVISNQQFAALGQPSVVSTLLSAIKEQEIKIIVLFMQSRDALTVFQQASQLSMLSATQVWIGSDGVATINLSDNLDLAVQLRGLIVTTGSTSSNSSEYFAFTQQLSAAVGTPVGAVDFYAGAYYDAAFTYAHAINSLLTAHGSYYNFSGEELYGAILNTHFQGVSGVIQFNGFGDFYPAEFEVLNWRNMSFENIGRLSPVSTTTPQIMFNDGTFKVPSDTLEAITIPIALTLPLSAIPEFCIAYQSITTYIMDTLNEQEFIPNRTFGLIVKDDQGDPGVGTVRTVELVNQNVVAVIGSLTSSVTKQVAAVLSAIGIPQVSFASTSPDLSNRVLYPYFLRNVPSDSSQSEAMAAIVNMFGWKKVITVSTREPYGNDGVQAFNNVSNSVYGTEITFSGSFPVGATDLSELMRQIAGASSTIIVAFVNLNDCPTLFREIKRAGLMGDGYVWIHTDACASWGRSYNTTAFDEDLSLGQAMAGMLGVTPYAGGGGSYTEWAAKMASLDPIKYPGLSDVTSIPYTSHCYDIPFMLAHAIRDMVAEGKDYTNRPALLAQLKKTSYEGITGTNAFDANGNRVSRYNLLSWSSSSAVGFSQVGQWDPMNNEVIISTPTLPWLGTSRTYPSGRYIPSGSMQEEESSIDTAIIAVVVVLGSLLLIAVLLLAFFFVRRKHKKEKLEVPASIWDDDPLLKSFITTSSDSIESLQGADSGKQMLKFSAASSVSINKTELTFGLSSNDRFPIDKKQRDEVEITNTSNSTRKLRVFVPHDPSRFSCQVFPGVGEIRRNETLILRIEFKLFLMTHIHRRIKIEIDGCSETCYLSMNFKGDVSDKIDPDEIDIQGEPIGEGGFGLVYRGRFRGTEVAVKTAHAKNEGVKSFLDEFTRELDMMRRLHHPNIITFIGASFITGKMGIVTEFCKRGSLMKLIHSGKTLPYGLKVKIALDIANGVSFLHENGVLHRDIKPDNVLLVSTNFVERSCAKLTDFGTAKSVNQHLQNFAHTNGIGTPIYMAPEILQRMQYSTKVDVFSFGVLLWELYTQLHPYHFIKLHWDIPGFVISGNRNPIPADCPKELEQLITQCWTNDPEDRPSFASIVVILDNLLQPIRARSKTVKYNAHANDLNDSDEESNSSPMQTDSRNTTGNSSTTRGHSTTTLTGVVFNHHNTHSLSSSVIPSLSPSFLPRSSSSRNVEIEMDRV